MSDRHIFVGLGEYAAYLAKEISAKVPNSHFFSMNDWPVSSVSNSYGISKQGLRIQDYYLPLLPEIRLWHHNPQFLVSKYNITYFSRSDVRMIYEYRYKRLVLKIKDDEIFVKELSQTLDGDTIHILIPSCDEFARSVAFFVGWDIKKYINKICKDVSVIAHFILPDTMIYNYGSSVELYHDYASSCAFIKELICIAEICNGSFKNNINIKNSNFEISHWFNGVSDYGCVEKLPFDGISFEGYKDIIDLEDHQLHSQVRNELPNDIIDCISSRKENILSCRSKDFMFDLYEKCPMYSPGGRASEAYKKYQRERTRNNDSLHLDWRWDEMLINI